MTTSAIEGEIPTRSENPRDLGLNVTLKTYLEWGQSDMRDSRVMPCTSRPLHKAGRDSKKVQVASTRREKPEEIVSLISGKGVDEIHY